MRTWGSVVAALCVFTLSPLGAQFVFGAEAPSDCGIPADVHDGWTMTSPEKQGVNATLLCAMGDGISGGKLANVDGVVIVRHGVLVYERHYSRFDAATRHNGYSMTKSVVSLLVGIAMDRGLISDLDVPVVSYFPENADLRMPGKDPITLRHLLTMSAGLGSSGAPGIAFAYSDGETELIGAILKKVTGKAVDVLAQEDLFAPLGIKDVSWSRDPLSGLPTSAHGLSLRPRDWAKIGQLVLNRGVWEGQQIVSASWVAQSTAEQIKTDEPLSAGYGYQWWLGRSLDKGRDVQWVAAKGFNSQKIIVIPALDMVVVFNASRQSKNMVAPELDLLDRYILPAAANDGSGTVSALR
ncbi:serine hydrolase [Bradyrhizobium sp. 138]|uniref:serine hydrolase domain-containing protein n=1 Tax=Bradyrhizobium sp. 138 TaxID=2782615 RepID=UPI001FFB2BFF|nr:serine hydrolase [Bradyrhizobium sp. 138]MCK1737135.1 serine hydrolase [Bradyrhizobium sp. 138]